MHGDHVGKLPNRWRASVRATWGANLGHFQAESVLGPKMKFEARELLFIFHLESMVIRALDQQVIRLQSECQRVDNDEQKSKLMVQTKSHECHHYTCSYPSCILQHLFWDPIMLLSKITRTRDAKVDDNKFQT